MAKKFFWDIKEAQFDEETGEATGEIITHKLSLSCSNLSGKALITIDGKTFDISVKPFSLRSIEQVFRLGDMAAKLSFSKKSEPIITVDGKDFSPSKNA